MAAHIALGLLLAFAMNTSTSGQPIKTKASLHRSTEKALSYFKQVEGLQFDNYLQRIRLTPLDPELRVKVLNMLPKSDIVNPSAEGQAKLKTVEPILKYHQRDSIIELKVLRASTATAVFLAGAAVLVTEPALRILTAEELQAVVAHELGHEYYWSRFEHARQNYQYLELQELELRSDGIAVITLCHLGLNPKSLISAIIKLNRHNGSSHSTSSQNYVPLEERIRFIRSMVELVRVDFNLDKTKNDATKQ